MYTGQRENNRKEQNHGNRSNTQGDGVGNYGKEDDIAPIFMHAFKPFIYRNQPMAEDEAGRMVLDKATLTSRFMDVAEDVAKLLREICNDARLKNPTIDRHYAYHIITTLFNKDGTRNDKTIADLKPSDEAFAEKLFNFDDHIKFNTNISVYEELNRNGEDHIQYAKQIRERCGGDKEVEDIVENGLRSIAMNGEGELRSEAAVFKKIDAIKASVAEAREVEKKYPGFMERFRSIMISLNGSALPEGAIKRMVEAAEQADVSKLAKLNSFSCSGTILAAIDQLHTVVADIGDARKYYPEGKADGETAMHNACHGIVEMIAVMKAGPAAHARIANAVNGKAFRCAAYILDARKNEASNPEFYPDKKERICREKFFSKEFSILNDVARLFQPPEDPEGVDFDDLTVEEVSESTEYPIDTLFNARIDEAMKKAGDVQLDEDGLSEEGSQIETV